MNECDMKYEISYGLAQFELNSARVFFYYFFFLSPCDLEMIDRKMVFQHGPSEKYVLAMESLSGFYDYFPSPMWVGSARRSD